MGGAAKAIGMVLNVGGSALQAKSTIDAGDAQYEAGLINSIQARRAGYLEEARQRTEGRRELSRERVAFAKAGVAIEGSPLELLAQNAMELERNALNARLQGLRVADVEKRAAKNIRRSAHKQAMAEILSGVTSTGMMGYKL